MADFCFRDGKVRYPDKVSARAQLARMKRGARPVRMRGIEVYGPCTTCAGYHLGHQPGMHGGARKKARRGRR